MIFIYNETNLNLALTCKSIDDTTSVELIDKDKTERTAIITNASDQTVAEAIVNRYNDGVDITSKLSKEYIMVKGTRILMNPENDTTVSVGKTDEKINNKDTVLVKNMVVLVLHKDSKFFIKAKNINKKANIAKFGDEYKVVTMYIKTNNWSYLREPMNILIQSGYGFESNACLDMETETLQTNEGKEYTRNVIKLSDYDGEFPQIAAKPKKKFDRVNTYKDSKFNKNFNSKGNGGKFNNTHRNGNRGR